MILSSSRMLRSFDWKSAADVAGQDIGPILKNQEERREQ
jgi:hypothetical protein